MSSPEDYFCKTDGVLQKSNSKRIVYFKINGSRIELRCSNCNGLVNWWVKHPRPVKRGWSEKESEAMR
jgi:hypothetical protein